MEKVLVGKVLECEKHPNADKLKVTKIDIGTGEPLQIVCGAPNVAKDQLVVVACVGAKLPEFEITARKLRGVESFGMLCSAAELGWTDFADDGILVLNETNGYVVGEEFKFQISSRGVFDK